MCDLCGRLVVGGNTIPLQDSIDILGVEVNSQLLFNCHLENAHHEICATHTDVQCPLPPQPAGQSAEKSRAPHQGCLTPVPSPQQPWQQQQQMSAKRHTGALLTVLHKAQIYNVPHLADLRATWRRLECCTRTVQSNGLLLEVPWSCSSSHQWTFSSATAAWWT
ncbi:hypothetical protein E2C01_027623 [Portunus trituberculatus]|uniref:Uncharacterized protein n=1 Tax=Portunus trituberculatus TaxID=210409 RepID=A0A5B7EM45_PORTR|nr:hypothetical protein [Portunus trituberculatus]